MCITFCNTLSSASGFVPDLSIKWAAIIWPGMQSKLDTGIPSKYSLYNLWKILYF